MQNEKKVRGSLNRGEPKKNWHNHESQSWLMAEFEEVVLVQAKTS